MGKIEITAKQSAIAFVLSFVFCQLALAIFSLIGLTINRAVSGNNEWFSAFLDSSAWGLIVQTIIMELIFAAFFVYFNFKSNNKEQDFKRQNLFKQIKAKKLILYILIATLSFFCLYPIIVCTQTWLTKLGVSSSGVYINSSTDFVLAIFSLAILPAIGEELLFRGVILRGYKNYGKAVAIILSTLSFAIFHMSLMQFLYPILFGLLLNSIMYKENNILYTIAMHLTNNLLALIVEYFRIPLIFNHFCYIILAVILCIAYLIAILWFVFYKNKGTKTRNFGKDKYWVIGSFILMSLIWIGVVVAN